MSAADNLRRCADQMEKALFGDLLSEIKLTEAEEMRGAADEIEKLIDLLCLADETIMGLHGCFPLDTVTEEQRILNRATKAIRARTGDDYEARKRRAARAIEATK